MSIRLLLILTVGIVLFSPSVLAFGAGNVPSFSYLEGKAFRHGDIGDTLAELVKKSGGFLGRTSKFGGLDISRVYFGNWLRDYSQAVDIAGLKKLSLQAILNLVMALGFLSHGYATQEFEVTKERLGVYSCCEHIDNPKGYGQDEPNGDPRHLDPRLRGPVDPRELEIDPRTGMKNYIANEDGTWDTSSRLVRDRIKECIHLGRRARQNGSEADLYETYRLLGSLLHTLEDFPAHSNFVELSLRRLGYENVFCHTGNLSHIQSPAGRTFPLVTGTFGGSDFIHSLIGETSDHISEASVSDLSNAMGNASGSTSRGINSNNSDDLSTMLFTLPDGNGNDLNQEMNSVNEMKSRAVSGGREMSPQELHAALWKVLTFRDNVVKTIEKTIELIPGASKLVENITNAVNRYVFTTLEPLLKPIMVQAAAALGEGSETVIASNKEQFEVFDEPYATDPTHSFLSKDHFDAILNEPAGKLAVIIVSFTVKQIVAAWDSVEINPDTVAASVLKTFHHPYFYDQTSPIQSEMGAFMKGWMETQDKAYTLNALTKESVRAGRNKRKGHVVTAGQGQGGHSHSAYNHPTRAEGVNVQTPSFSGVEGNTYAPPPGAPPIRYTQVESSSNWSNNNSQTELSQNQRPTASDYYKQQQQYQPPQQYQLPQQYQQQPGQNFYSPSNNSPQNWNPPPGPPPGSQQSGYPGNYQHQQQQQQQQYLPPGPPPGPGYY